MLNEIQKSLIADAQFSQFKDFAGFKADSAELALFEANIDENKRVVICLDRCDKNGKPIHFLNISTQQLNKTFGTWDRMFGANTGITIYIGTGRVTMTHVKEKLNDWLSDTQVSIGEAKRLHDGIWHRLAKDLKEIEMELKQVA